MSFQIYDLRTEYMENPLGLDCVCPRFSWKMKSDAKGTRQTKYKIVVGTAPDCGDVWNSSVIVSDESNGIYYGGSDLKPCTRYYWTVSVWNEKDECVVSEGQFFETGLMDPGEAAWDQAQWIGAPYHTVSPDVRGIFALEASFMIARGSYQAGIVLGANDRRIKHENYFRFDVNIEQMPAKCSIYRVGIDKNDKKDVPLAVFDVCSYDSQSHEPVITEENKYDLHRIRLEITGNCVYTYMDGVRIDADQKTLPWGAQVIAPRQINPLGNNDVNTFPRLNEIGFYVPAGQKAYFDNIQVSNLRKPQAVIFEESAAHGMNEACTGKCGSIFESALSSQDLTVETVDGCKMFAVQAGTADVLVCGNPGHTSIPMLRRTFTVRNQAIAGARLYITSRGIYECHINGQPVTDTWFNPGETQYDHHLMYQTYALDHMLVPGENAVGVILASGWWSDAQTFVLGNYNYYGDRESLLAKIVISYADGTKDVYVTDTDSWKYSGDGPFTYAGFFHGEHYDAVRGEAYADFAKPGYDDSLWQAPAVIEPVSIGPDDVEHNGPFAWPTVNMGNTQIIGQVGGGVYAVGEIQAQSVKEISPGVYIYDMGYNIAGVPKLKLHGKRNTQATIRFAEILYPDLPEYEGLEGTMMIENLRDADCTDLYTFAGDENGEAYMPRFTFRGYRYIEISGVDKAPALDEVRTVQLSSVKKMTGNVRTSFDMLNMFIDNVRRSQLANFISVPTDCPQRNERMGWDGDTEVFSRTASFNSDVRLFYYRYLQAMRDLQVDGKYPDIAPVGGGFGGYTYNSAGLIVTWEVYQQYGDLQVIKDNYEAMKAFMDYSARINVNDNLTGGVMTLGDWLSPEETDLDLICYAFYGYNARIMSKMAGAIGEEQDARDYEKLYHEIKAYWNQRFVDKQTGKTADDTQCSYALPLAYGMVDEAYVQAFGDHLADKTKRTDYRVTTGFFGTAPLNPMLTVTGHKDDAYKLMAQTQCPSWLYSVTQGATSIWERWNSYTHENGFGGNNSMNSFNHYSLGAVCEWLYMYVLGILRDEDRPGYKHFTAKPEIGSWDSADGFFESPYGTIRAGWKKTENGYTYHLSVPANSCATVILPDGHTEEVGSGDYEYCFS